MFARLLKSAFLIGAILAFCWIAGLAAFAVSLHGHATTSTATTKEAIIVLTGGPHRVNAGLDMLADGKAGQLFISGVNTQVSEKDLLALWDRKPPAKFCCIILGHAARNTAENADEVSDWMNENDLNSAYLVTARTRMPRAKLEMKRTLPHADIAYVPVDDNSPRLKTCLLTLNEYNKTLLTWIKLKVL